MKKLLVILGPTATGKTDLALNLAKNFSGELVACDSRQVYRGLDIGTGKEPRKKSEVVKKKGYWEIAGVRIWMYDLVDLKEQYTVASYVGDATRIINDIENRGKLPIIVGGTGFYLKALIEGLSVQVPADLNLRKKIEKLPVGELQKKLNLLSPGKLSQLNESDKQNPRRLIRHIELLSHNPMYGFMEPAKITPGLKENHKILKIGLTAPRQILYQNIDGRVLSWIRSGIIKEVEDFYKKGITKERLKMLGLEYGVIADFLENKIKSKDELIKTMQFKIHGYLRRQQTWFKKEEKINWFDITSSKDMVEIDKLVAKWYDMSHD